MTRLVTIEEHQELNHNHHNHNHYHHHHHRILHYHHNHHNNNNNNNNSSNYSYICNYNNSSSVGSNIIGNNNSTQRIPRLRRVPTYDKLAPVAILKPPQPIEPIVYKVTFDVPDRARIMKKQDFGLDRQWQSAKSMQRYRFQNSMKPRRILSPKPKGVKRLGGSLEVILEE